MKRIPWKSLGTADVHANPWFRVRRDKVVRPDGKRGEYYVVETRGASVFVAALNERGEACLVRLYRYPTRRWSLEVPGGNSDGQSPLTAAKRELLEETGFAARKWTPLGSWQTVNGLSSELSYGFIARGLRDTGRHSREEEGIERVIFVPFPKLVRMVADGRVSDGQTIALVFKAALKMGVA